MEATYFGSPVQAHARSTVSDMSTSGLDQVLHAAELAQQRQAKTLANLARQVDLTLEQRAELARKEQRRDQRLAEIGAKKEQERRLRVERSAEAEARRRSRLEEAEKIEEDMRQRAMDMINNKEHKMSQHEMERMILQEQARERSSRVAARREEAYRTSMALAEQKRREAEQRQGLAEELRRQREDLQRIQAQIKAEEDYMKEQKRQATKGRADKELANRQMHHEDQIRRKDALLQMKKAELAAAQALKAEEARQRQMAIHQNVRWAAERDAMERERMNNKVAQKMEKANAIVEQREQLVTQMSRVRQQMAIQEGAIRASLDSLHRGGNTYALSGKVLQAMEQYQSSPSPQRFNAHVASPSTPAVERTHSFASPQPYRPQSAAPVRSVSRNRDRSASTSMANSPSNMQDMKRMRRRLMSAASPAVYGDVSSLKLHEHDSRVYSTAGPTPDPTSRQEEVLRLVLEEEMSKEYERQQVLKNVADEKERMRLIRMFMWEREESKERILGLMPGLPVTMPEFKAEGTW